LWKTEPYVDLSLQRKKMEEIVVTHITIMYEAVITPLLTLPMLQIAKLTTMAMI